MKKLIFPLLILTILLYFFGYKKAEEKGLIDAMKLASGKTDRVSRAKRLGIEIIPGKELFAAIPLEIPFSSTETYLDPSQILAWTNKHRKKDGLKALTFNETLNEVAQAKVNDMFEQDYFAHESPDGIGPADLAKEYGYKYILVGENLAKGNFGTDKKLVQAWMDSPGHRANILKSGYTEIGVAVGLAKDRGRDIWLAVQSFGTPKSLCEEPDEDERDDIESEQEELRDLVNEIEGRKADLKEVQEDVLRGEDDFEYLKKETAYFNELVNEYNLRGKNLNERASAFDQTVRNFNSCLNSF